MPRAFAEFGCKFIALGFMADRITAARTKEAVMTSLCIQAWVLPLIGIRSALAHSEIMEMLEVLDFLGNSYRLASSGGSSSVVYSRFTFDFCRAFAAGTACNLASRRSALQALRNVRTRNATVAWRLRKWRSQRALQNQSHFTRVFLRIVGVTPGAWQRRLDE